MEQDILLIIAKHIKEMRIRRGLSQNKLAKTLNIGQPVLSRIENGHSNVAISNYVSVLTFLNYKITSINDENLHHFFDDLRKGNKKRLTDYEQEILDKSSLQTLTLTDIICLKIIQSYLAYFNRNMKRFKQFISILEAFSELADDYFIYRLKQLQGLYHIMTLEYGRAEQLLESAYSHSLRCGKEDELILYQRCWIYSKQKNFTQSSLCLYEAEQFANFSQNTNRIIDIDNLLAINYMADYETDLAIAYLKRCENSTKAKHNDDFYSQVIYNLGLSHYLKKDYEKAALYFERSFKIKDSRRDHGLTLSYLLKTLIILKDEERLATYQPFIKEILADEHQTGKKFVQLVKIELEQGKTETYYKFLEKEIIPSLNPSYNRIRLKLLYEELSQFYWNHKQYKNYKMIVNHMMSLIT
ncbi:helix-turn-helix domain-containing protein [Haloplasma contractile]|uniref:UDP-N-acetylglucosamine transferase protein n=1 Tax=Haloplasma contractile SSD-17B TaxID=1033810 RepID=U2DYZ4_9MOLU|nr:helix-turn-helix transcriptional regulator [Haloplasma contractile]ERJ13457.1 Putative UDP-N-acetylglucosamine transferase protein [Haloplasma contractile SSD-17B]